jgi:hypothetical protein
MTVGQSHLPDAGVVLLDLSYLISANKYNGRRWLKEIKSWWRERERKKGEGD